MRFPLPQVGHRWAITTAEAAPGGVAVLAASAHNSTRERPRLLLTFMPRVLLVIVAFAAAATAVPHRLRRAKPEKSVADAETTLPPAA